MPEWDRKQPSHGQADWVLPLNPEPTRCPFVSRRIFKTRDPAFSPAGNRRAGLFHAGVTSTFAELTLCLSPVPIQKQPAWT